jgi:predicted metal-dependent hydrolase
MQGKSPDREIGVEWTGQSEYHNWFARHQFAPAFSNLQSNLMVDQFQAGIIFFNAGRYFEAHEAWEDLWRESRGPLRFYYQGLVQAAVGLHHLGRGNLNGATAQLQKSLAKLEQYPEKFCRIDNRGFVADLRKVLESRAPFRVLIRADR